MYSRQLLGLITVLRTDPIPYKVYDVAKLESVEDSYRVRVGDIRLVYWVDWVKKVVEITFIGPRGRAYKGS